MGGAATRLSIFLSYRREDAADAAGRLYDSLVTRFGAGSVFLDIDTIDPGADFTEAVEGALASCDVLLALIGRQWLTAADARGRPRLEDPGDLVRVEVQTALASGIRVIPVLVQGVTMPTPDQLPDGLKELAHRNAVEMTAARWSYDVDQLTGALWKIAQRQDAAPTPRAERGQRSGMPVLAALGVVAVIAGGVTAGLLLSAPSHGTAGGKHTSGSGRPASPSSSPTLPELEEKRSSPVKGVPFTIDYPTAWTVDTHDPSSMVSFDLSADSASDVSYISIGNWSVQEAVSELDSESVHVSSATEQHSSLTMTVLDWNNSPVFSSNLNSNQGHQRLYVFGYHGSEWDVQCGWGTTGPVTTAETEVAESACLAAVNSIRPAP